VHPAGGQFPRQPAIDRPEGQFAAFGAGAGPRNVVEQPFQLGAGKVGIDHQPGALAERLGMAGGRQ